MESDLNAQEAERQLEDAAARHREVVASLAQGGRAASSETSAIRAVARGVQLVTYALRRAQDAGVSLDRLAAISGWDPDVITEALNRGPEPVFGYGVPEHVDADAVARAAATLDALARIEELMRRIRADLADESWSPAPVDLDDLHERIESQWQVWREALGRRTPAPTE